MLLKDNKYPQLTDKFYVFRFNFSISTLLLVLLAFGIFPVQAIDPCAYSYLNRAEFRNKVLQDYKIPKSNAFDRNTSRRLTTSTKKIFPNLNKSQQKSVEQRINEHLIASLEKRADDLKVEDVKSLLFGNDDILHGAEYKFYVDQFASKWAEGNFETVTKMLDYLDDLGVKTISPLPFLKSPFKDGGYDISDLKAVAEKFGGDEAFEAFLNEAKKRKMNVKMDLILNHVSEKHTWFQKFLNGDLRYKDYFVVRDKPPEIVKRFTNNEGSFVRYREFSPAEGKIVEVDRRLIFPDIADSHYRKVQVRMNDGQMKDYWAFHTFYPHQIDLNFYNPEVLMESLDVISHWANKGIDIFRLDAIPFLDKFAENHERTHRVISVLQSYLKQLSPKSVLLVEANQAPKEIIKYFGKNTKAVHKATGIEMQTTTEATMAYNFKEIPNWASIYEQDKKYFNQVMQSHMTLPNPENVYYVNFARVHDEKTLEMVTPEVRKAIADATLRQVDGQVLGLPFREGEGVIFGIGGRTASFLQKDPQRIEQSFALLVGRPGKPLIYFGDEIGIGNNIEYMISEAKKRMKYMVDNNIPIQEAKPITRKLFDEWKIPTHDNYNGKRYPLPIDTRDANRGPIDRDLFLNAQKDASSFHGKVYSRIKNLLKIRNNNPVFSKGVMKLIPNKNEHIISYTLEHEGKKVLVLSNLSDSSQVFSSSILKENSYTDLINDMTLKTHKKSIQLDRHQSIWFMLN